MYRLRYRVWDTQEQQWFKPYYAPIVSGQLPDLKEILSTQNGDLVLRERVNGVETLTDNNSERFIKNGRVGIRDKNGNKYYFNDIVSVILNPDEGGISYPTIGQLIWYNSKLALSRGPVDNYNFIYIIDQIELNNGEIVGNIYQNKDLIVA